MRPECETCSDIDQQGVCNIQMGKQKYKMLGIKHDQSMESKK